MLKNNKIDFQIDLDVKKIYRNKNHKNTKKTKINNFNKNNIYYGLFFIFLFGFLFFLTISVSFASSKEKINSNNDNFILTDTDLEDYFNKFLYPEQNNNQNKVELKTNLTKKIEFSKYRVKKDDKIESIANKFGLSTETLMLINNIKYNNSLKSGLILLIPNQDGRIIKIEKDDNIYKIANRYGVSWESIVDANDISSNNLKIGDKLFIPGSKMTNYEKKYYFEEKFDFPVNGKITSYFGPRIDPFTQAYTFHTGIDIKSHYGAKVKSSKSGIVSYIGFNNTYGNYIEIKHNDNIITIYAHLSKILVKNNQKVEKDEIIGLVGSSGRSTGSHLHFEIRKNGKIIDPLNLL